jgi:hypothetical protein
MEASPAPKQAIRLLLEISRTTDRRIEGRMRADGSGAWRPFSGVLELLKVLEETCTDLY